MTSEYEISEQPVGVIPTSSTVLEKYVDIIERVEALRDGLWLEIACSSKGKSYNIAQTFRARRINGHSFEVKQRSAKVYLRVKVERAS